MRTDGQFNRVLQLFKASHAEKHLLNDQVKYFLSSAGASPIPDNSVRSVILVCPDEKVNMVLEGKVPYQLSAKRAQCCYQLLGASRWSIQVEHHISHETQVKFAYQGLAKTEQRA